MTDLLTAFGLIALAELGDKSQLLALSFAARYRWWQVLTGVVVAATVLLGVAAGVGGALGDVLPGRAVALGGGTLFLAFAVWTWWDTGDEHDEPAEPGADVTSPWRAIVTVVVAFVVAELGDKTMLAAATLASARSSVAVWLGGVLGMTLVAGLAIVVGRLLGRRLPARRLRHVAALAFAVVGLLLLLDAAGG